MIQIELLKKNGDYVSLKLKGHAGYNYNGNDVVCAAVSILVLNTVNSIEKIVKEKILVVKEEQKDGILEVNLSYIKSNDSKVLLKSMAFGLEQIKKKYGKKYIDINIREV